MVKILLHSHESLVITWRTPGGNYTQVITCPPEIVLRSRKDLEDAGQLRLDEAKDNG